MVSYVWVLGNQPLTNPIDILTQVIARTAAAGLFIGIGAGVHNDMADILEDGDQGPVPPDAPDAPVTEKAEKALATLSEATGCRVSGQV